MTITIERIGRRSYLRGNTYPIKDQIKSAGGHWDGDQRAWWLGDDAEAQRIAGGAASTPVTARKVDADAKVVGKAAYKGRNYYVLWAGRTSRGGEAAHLTTLDASIDFWAALEPTEGKEMATITKRYQAPKPLSSIRQWIEDKRAVEAAQKDGGGSYEDCPQCRRMFARGVWGPYSGSGDYEECSMCGSTHEELR